MKDEIINKLAIKIASNALNEAQLEVQNEQLQEELSVFKAVLESDSDLKELFEETKAKLGGN